MERLSESESDDDAREDIERRLSSRVLRPAITSLPSIDDDRESDEEDSSSETEVVFSNINWAAEESTGLAFDLEQTSPGPSRSTPGAPSLATGLRPEGRARLPDAPNVLRTTTIPPSAAADAYTSAVSPSAKSGPASQTASHAHPPTSPAQQLPSRPAPNASAAAVRDSTSSTSVTSRPHGNESYDMEEPYEGRGWLSGAAGRLADVTKRRRAAIAATDAEQVAAAASDASALRLQLLQHQQEQHEHSRHQGQQRQREAAAVGSPRGTAPECEFIAVAAALGAAPGDLEADTAQQLQREQERWEQEQRLSRDFHDAIEAAEAEPPLVASSSLGLSLEATVAGLEMDDLDALIARLAAGTAELGATSGSRESGVPAAADAAGASGSGGSDGGGGSNAAGCGLWAALRLPAADSLWSDDEEREEQAEEYGKGPIAQLGGAPLPPRAAIAQPAAAPSSPRKEEVMAAGSADRAQAVAGVEAEAVIGATGMAEQPSAAINATSIVSPAGPAPQLPPTLPAKFKFFAGPSGPGAVPPYPSAQPQQPAGGAATVPGAAPGVPAAVPGGGPVRVDLRQSIVEAVQRNSREVAEAAARQESEAKAAAARRRMVSASESDSGGEGEEEQREGGAASRARPERPPAVRQVPTRATAAGGQEGEASSPANQQAPPSTAAVPPPPPIAPGVSAAAVAHISATPPTVAVDAASNRPKSDQAAPALPTPTKEGPPMQQAAAAPSVVPTQAPAQAALAAPAAPKAPKPRAITDSIVTTASVTAAPVAAVPATAAEQGPAGAVSRRFADIGGGGATAVTASRPPAAAAARVASVGTDAADLRPPSRSAFVCTAERREEESQEEEQRRVEDIREYLKARAAAAARAAAPPPPEERRWPEPPAAVSQRIASLAAAKREGEGECEAAKEPARQRVVATMSGGDDRCDGDDEGLANGNGGAPTAAAAPALAATAAAVSTPDPAAAPKHCADGEHAAALGADARPLANTDAATIAPEDHGAQAAPLVFAACSTEGDEDLVSEPAPSSMVDASQERGARLAAAGTVIRLNVPSAAETVVVADRHASAVANGPVAGGLPAGQPAAAASGGFVDGGNGPRDAVRPAALEVPSPTDAATPAPAANAAPSAPSPAGGPDRAGPRPATAATVTAATATSTASAAAGPTAAAATTAPTDASGTAAAGARPRGAPAPADLYRLPAWLPQASCFTLLVTSPNNMTTREAGAVVAWLLQAAAESAPAPGDPAARGAGTAGVPGVLPAFSVVGVRLLGAAPNWPLLPPACRAAAGAGGGDVRVLAVACVPRAGVDPDAYGHELPETAAVDAAAARVTAQQLTAELAAVLWGALPHDAIGTGSAGAPASGAAPSTRASAQGQATYLAGWTSAHSGAELLFSPLRLPPHALSHYHQPRANGPTSPGSSPHDAVASSGGGGDGGVTFACVVTSGVLRNPQLLTGILRRAAQVGLTLRGLQVMYATEEAAAAIVASTPHRPLPYIGAAVLAMSGANEPLRRWQDQLGPPDARLAARTEPSSLHALYGEAARHITCSYDSTTAAREVAVLFAAGPGSGGGDAQAAAPSPSSPSGGQALRSPKTAAAGPAPTTQASPRGAQPLHAGTIATGATALQLQSQWLALPACGAVQQALALWCAQHLLWCGYSLRALVIVSLPSAAACAVASQRPGQGVECGAKEEKVQQTQHDTHNPLEGIVAADAVAAPALVLEVNKEEAREQLPVLLTSLPCPLGMEAFASTAPPPSPSTTLPTHEAAAGSAPAAGSSHPAAPSRPPLLALSSLRTSDVLRATVTPSDVQSLPQPYIAEELLAAAAAVARQADGQFVGGAAEDVTAASSNALSLTPPPNFPLHHGVDEVAVVALQGRPLHAAALLLAALVMHTTGVVATVPGAVAGAAASGTRRGPGSHLELVACRCLRQVPSDVASCLAVLQPQHQPQWGAAAAAAASTAGPYAVGGSGSAAAAGGAQHRPAHRLVISQPALLAVFHGPAAQARVAGLLQAAVPRFGASAAAPPAEPAGASDAAAWHALLDKLLRDYPTAVAAAPPLAAVSASQASAKRALVYAFSPAQVFLDAGLHDGVQRPPLSASVVHAPATAATAMAAPLSPLGRLLAGPERLPAVVAVDCAALHRNVLPRLLKQLRREGYTLHGAATRLTQPGSAAAAAMPSLAGRPAVLLHVSRSNAVLHLRSLAVALATVGAPPLSDAAAVQQAAAGLYTCGTWRDVATVVAEVWPPAQQQQHGTAAVPEACGGAAGVGGGAAPRAVFLRHSGSSGAVPVRRFVRPEGSRLLQLTAMVLTPSMSPADGGAPSLDWLRFADALDALHAEGFRLAAMTAASATPRDIADLARASCRISPAQQQALHAAATAALTATTSVGADAAAPALPPPSNIIVLAMSRDNAVTSLQILMDEATRAASAAASVSAAGLQGQAAAGTNAAAAAIAGLPRPGAAAGALAPWGAPGRREAAAALAALVQCMSVSHSPAAAEQQVTSVFDGVFGVGGVALVR